MDLGRKVRPAGVKHRHFAPGRAIGLQHFDQFAAGEKRIHGDAGRLDDAEARQPAVNIGVGLVDRNGAATRLRPILAAVLEIPGQGPAALSREKIDALMLGQLTEGGGLTPGVDVGRRRAGDHLHCADLPGDHA